MSGGRHPRMGAVLTAAPSNLWTPDDVSTLCWFDASHTPSFVIAGGNITEWRDRKDPTKKAIQNSVALQPSLWEPRTCAAFGYGELLAESPSRVPLQPNAPRSFFVVCAPIAEGKDDYQHMLTVSDSNNFANNDAPGIAFVWATSPGTAYQPNVAAIALYAIQKGAAQGAHAGYVPVSAYNFADDWALIQSQNDGGMWDARGKAPGVGSPILYDDRPLGSNISLRIGSGLHATNKGAAYIAEIIGMGAVDDNMRNMMMGYLAHKWGMTKFLPANHPYKTVPPTK